jgi:hypothetical protein
MRSTILSRYDGTSTTAYRGTWKQAFKRAVSQLSLSIGINNREDLWNHLIDQHIDEKTPIVSRSVTTELNSTEISSRKSCTSTSSVLYQRKLLPVDYSRFVKTLPKLQRSGNSNLAEW